MGSGGGGRETSRADGETKGSPWEVFVGGGDFKELPLVLTPFDAGKSLVLMFLELFRLKRPMVVAGRQVTSLSEERGKGGVRLSKSRDNHRGD